MPKKKTITLANPDQPGAQAAMDGYRPSDNDGTMNLIIGTNFFVTCMLVSQGSFGLTGAAAILLYVIWGALVLVLAFVGVRGYRRRRAYNRHVKAGNIIIVDGYLTQAWDELCEEQGVRLSGAERQVEVRKLFTAATELRDELQQCSEAGDSPELAEARLLAAARIRARLAREVDTLRAVREAQRQIAKLPAADIDIVTAEEVQVQLRALRARRTAGADAEPDQEK